VQRAWVATSYLTVAVASSRVALLEKPPDPQLTFTSHHSPLKILHSRLSGLFRFLTVKYAKIAKARLGMWAWVDDRPEAYLTLHIHNSQLSIYQVFIDRLGAAFAITHGEDDGGGASNDVASGKNAGDAGHAVFIGVDVAPLVQL